jgi:hypothetical protein
MIVRQILELCEFGTPTTPALSINHSLSPEHRLDTLSHPHPQGRSSTYQNEVPCSFLFACLATVDSQPTHPWEIHARQLVEGRTSVQRAVLKS